MLRALLIVAVLWAWMYVVAAAVGGTVWLLVAAVRARRGALAPIPSRSSVVAVAVHAAVMAAAATAMMVLSLSGPQEVSLAEAVPWAALPAWAALVAVAVLAVLLRRRFSV